MRIREIVSADFRNCERTLYSDYLRTAKLPRADEIVVFISLKGDQLLFVHGWQAVHNPGGPNHLVLKSSRHRIANGTWNPLLLRNYVNAAGLEIEGLRRFEDYYRDLANAH